MYEVIREDGSVAENLSEGERNFIAFLYFYHQVRGSMTGEELKEKIVVIDDPVSSMDSTALFLVSALLFLTGTIWWWGSRRLADPVNDPQERS